MQPSKSKALIPSPCHACRRRCRPAAAAAATPPESVHHVGSRHVHASPDQGRSLQGFPVVDGDHGRDLRAVVEEDDVAVLHPVASGHRESPAAAGAEEEDVAVEPRDRRPAPIAAGGVALQGVYAVLVVAGVAAVAVPVRHEQPPIALQQNAGHEAAGPREIHLEPHRVQLLATAAVVAGEDVELTTLVDHVEIAAVEHGVCNVGRSGGGRSRPGFLPPPPDHDLSRGALRAHHDRGDDAAVRVRRRRDDDLLDVDIVASSTEGGRREDRELHAGAGERVQQQVADLMTRPPPPPLRRERDPVAERAAADDPVDIDAVREGDAVDGRVGEGDAVSRRGEPRHRRGARPLVAPDGGPLPAHAAEAGAVGEGLEVAEDDLQRQIREMVGKVFVHGGRRIEEIMRIG